MALTNLSQVTSSGIHTLSNYTTHNINSTGIITATSFSGNLSSASGISTFAEIRVTGNLTVEGTTTTLDSNLTEVDRIEVGANTAAVGVAVTQSGTGHVATFEGGNFGIGTNNPGANLDIAETGFVNVKVRTSGNNSATLNLQNSQRNFSVNNITGGAFTIHDSTANTERLRITSDGKVGIDATNPSKKLTVNGDILVTDENKIFLNSSADLALNDRKVLGNATWHYLWTEDFDGSPAPYTITQSSNDYSDFTNTNLALTYVSGTQPSGTVNAYVTVESNNITILAIRATGARDYDDTTVFEISTSTIGSGTQNLQFKILNSNFTRPETQFLSLGGDTEPTSYTYTPNLLKIGNNNFQNLSSVTSLNTLMSVGHNSFNGTLPSAINSAAFGTNIAQHARTINYCAFVGNLHGAFGQTYATSVGVGYQFSMRRNANWDIGIGHETVGESAPRGSTEITYTITTQPTSMPADGTYQYVNFNDKLGNKTYTYQTNIDVSGGAITSVSLGFAFQPKDLPAVNDVMSTTNTNFPGMELTVNSVTEIGGGYNVGVGGYTLRYIDGASGNTAIGHAALNNIGTGSYNISLGHNSGNAITTGSYNVVIGSNTGSGIATSSNNIILSDGQGNIRQFIDSNGNVGINDSSPSYHLDVNGSIRSQATGPGAGLLLHTNSGLSANGNLMQIWTGQASGISFHSNGTGDGSNEKLRITSAGNIGIGTDDPDVYSLGGNNKYAAIKASTGYSVLNLVDSNNSGSYLQFGNPTVRRGSLHFDSASNFLVTINESGSGTNLVEKLRLDLNGRLTISGQGLKLNPINSSLYTLDGSLSYYGTTNAVYLNGAGTNGWLRLNASGAENNQNAINIFGGGAGAYISMNTSNVERLRITSDGTLRQTGSSNALGQGTSVAKLTHRTIDPTTPGGVGDVTTLETISATSNGSDYRFVITKREGSGGGSCFINLGGNSDGSISFGTNTSGSGTERLRIRSGGPHLLIGTGGDATYNEITESSSNAGLVIGSSSMGNGGIVIRNSTSGTGRIYFADNSGSDPGRQRGQINYYHNGDYMMFATAGSERLRIASDGRITHTGKNGAAASPAIDPYSSFVLNDAEARLQLCATDGGSNAAGLILSNASKHWIVHQRGPNVSNRFDIGYLDASSPSDINAQASRFLSITTAGLVGVNCTPLSQFQVKAGTNANIGLTVMSNEAAIEAFNDAGSASVPLRLRGSEHKFFTSSIERLRIKADGRIGIGRDDPSCLLDIRDYTNTSGTSTGTTMMRLQNNVGSNSGSLGDITGINGQRTYIDFTFIDGNVNFTPQVRIGAQVGETSGTDTGIPNEGSGSFVVYTAKGTGSNGAGSLVENLRVDSDGNVGISSAVPHTGMDLNRTNGSFNKTMTSGSDNAPHMIVRHRNGNIRYFEYYFNCVKITNSGSIDKNILDITNMGNFFQGAFEVAYGTRLQGVSDATTSACKRLFGINKFNQGNVAITDAHDVDVDGNSNTHANLRFVTTGGSSVRLKVTFSGNISGSSFCSGVVRGWGVNDTMSDSGSGNNRLVFYNGGGG